jgi:hypothetical protein
MGPILFHIFILCLIGGVLRVLSFQPRPHHALSSRRGLGTTCYWLGDAKSSPEAPSDSKKKKDNKAMAFLKEIGKVGREANRDFRYAIGVDEGSSGKSAGNGMNVRPRTLLHPVAFLVQSKCDTKKHAILAFCILSCTYISRRLRILRCRSSFLGYLHVLTDAFSPLNRS